MRQPFSIVASIVCTPCRHTDSIGMVLALGVPYCWFLSRR